MTALVWPEIYFVRHGETPWNAERRYQGRKDIPQRETGFSVEALVLDKCTDLDVSLPCRK